MTASGPATMISYRKLLLLMDPSLQHTPALLRAVQLARLGGAELQLCLLLQLDLASFGHVSEEAASLARRSYLDERKQRLQKEATRLDELGLRVSTALDVDTPGHGKLLELIRKSAPDLVLKDLDLAPAARRTVFTPLDWQLLRMCPAPLLLVNPAAHLVPRRVIAAVDTANRAQCANGLNTRIVEAAAALATVCSAELHLAHAFEGLAPSAAAEISGATAFSRAHEALRADDRRTFETFAANHAVAEKRKHFIYGPTATSIAQFANDQSADVLVLGTMSKSGLEHLIADSTAERILNELHCDVLAVKPDGFMDDLARQFHFDKLRQEVEPQVEKPIQIGLV